MKEGTAGRRAVDKRVRARTGEGVRLTPEAAPLLLVEGHALREVSSELSWRGGHVELRLATGPATRRGGNEGYSLDIKVHERGEDENDRNSIGESLYFDGLEAVVAAHLALGLLIEKARESGWHDLKVEAVVSGGLPKFPAIMEG